jgi:hypothetical protein
MLSVVFNGMPFEVHEMMNEFFGQNQNINILSVTQSESAFKNDENLNEINLTVTIVYNTANK